MIAPHIGAAAAAGLIDSADAPPVLIFLSDRAAAVGVRSVLARGAARRVLSWLSLTSADDDPWRFVERMAASIGAHRIVAEGRGGRVEPFGLPVSRAPGGEETPGGRAIDALALLLDELHAGHRDRTVVLDGYGAITAAPVHRLVGYLLEFLPETLRIALFADEVPARIGVPRLLVRRRARLYLCDG